MILNERVKDVVKKACRPGIPANKDANQILMIEALISIKETYAKGFPSENILDEYILMEQQIIRIITETLEALAPIYD